MDKKLHRRWTPSALVELEGRTLLAAATPTATWIGQDGIDLVGPSSTTGPDGVQDIDIQLTGLPANLSIVFANLTGYGGGQWVYNGPPHGPWSMALVQSPGSTTADLYAEPYQVETGRYFFLTLSFSDGSVANLQFLGGTADPNLPMPADAVNATWQGQDSQDWTGPGPAVGPDGFQDAELAVANLSPYSTVSSATVTASGGGTWEFGTNPTLLPDAELIPNPGDSTKAQLYFSPQSNLNGQTLTLTIDYANGKTDSTSLVAGPTDPTLRMPTPAPVTVVPNAFSVRWAGQDGQDLTGPGDVHLELSGLPSGQTVTAAQLTDGTLNSWDYTSPGSTLNDSNELPLFLAFQPSTTDPTQADVDFPPIRNESQATMTLRLVLANGTNLVTTFPGGAADPGLRAPGIAATSVTANPGADLNSLANQFGTVHLTAGTYSLTAPLVLNQPVTITADPGVTLLFSQPVGAPAWTAAIKILAGHTTLNGFAVRFSGPINWNEDVSFGPALIGTRDNFDTGGSGLIEDLTLTNLDLRSPPAASPWEFTPDLIRVISAQNGVIDNNILKGGTTEFYGGPWQVVGNTYEGTLPDTYTTAAFAGHSTFDALIANNVVEPVGLSGKTYRFLVLTQSGLDDVVQNNTVIGIGPMDSDTEPNPNATEVLLTEAYYVEYEGVPLTISPDGSIVQISRVLAGEVQAGDVLSILAGPQAGQWCEIAQEINPTTYLLSSPIDSGTTAISITTGFIDESFIGNTINTTGSSTAADIDLAGNQFGVQVLDNTLIGGRFAFYISAYPSQTPSIFGWTHAPVLGAVISANTIEDSVEGGLLDVEHSSGDKTNVGRVYLSATLTNNTGVWTSSFITAPSAVVAAIDQLSALTVGMAPSNDPGELVVSLSGNQVEGPASVVSGATIQTVAATVNGQVESDQATILPALSIAAPTSLALVLDNGASPTGGQTGDAELQFNPVDGAAGYEYSLTGESGTYLPVASPSAFLPQGLGAGFNSVFVRAYDAAGDRGPDALLVFDYDPTRTTIATSTPPVAARAVQYEYRVGNTGPFQPLGISLTLTAAQEAAGPVAIQIQPVAAAAAGEPDTSPSGVATGTAVSATVPDPSATAVQAGSGIAAAPVSAASAPGLLSPDSIATSSVPGLLWPGAAETFKLANHARWTRHPNPFRRAGRASVR